MKNEHMKAKIGNVTHNHEKNTKPYDISEIIKLLADCPTASIPLAVMEMPVYAESKMMFGAVFAECMKKISEMELTDPQEQLRNMIKKSIAEKTVGQIMANGVCYSEVKAEIVRKEVAEIADKIDFSAYFTERSVS